MEIKHLNSINEGLGWGRGVRSKVTEKKRELYPPDVPPLRRGLNAAREILEYVEDDGQGALVGHLNNSTCVVVII